MSTVLQGRYHGRSKPLFLLYLKTSFLTLITLGIYRFWAKTRVRKYIWSGTTAGQDGFEYTGTGLEKLLGFLVAVVILAIYLGVIQMILLFFGFQIFVEPQNEFQMLAQMAGIYITLLAVLPLIFFARYRARRYKLARTRWRGIRFAMENAAWGYAFRALGYYLISAMTLGILTPLATFNLEKYMADRTWYGDGRFEQKGRWQALFGGMKHVFIGVAILIVVPAVGAITGAMALFAVGAIVGYIWLLVGFVYYRVFALNYLARNRVLDGAVTFEAEASTGEIVKTVIIGSIVVGLIMGVIFGVVLGIVFSAGAFTVQGGGGGIAGIIAAVLMAVLYVFAFLVAGALNMVMILQPIIAHIVDSFKVHNEEHLNSIQQRSADLGADAEGFADALDVGGAI